MSKSRANELLQDLHARLSANWKGREHFSTTQPLKCVGRLSMNTITMIVIGITLLIVFPLMASND